MSGWSLRIWIKRPAEAVSRTQPNVRSVIDQTGHAQPRQITNERREPRGFGHFSACSSAGDVVCDPPGFESDLPKHP
jgi:hypothetical protein